MARKAPGFWFFTGDWLKDPELRFCSLFARGLLVDLLCFCFESQEQGFLSHPDGTPRSDRQIVDSISGGDTPDKLAALAELEKSGVLSRDSRGVLYSRRISRLAKLSSDRRFAGHIGGSKTSSKRQANRAANVKQTEQQNKGVSDSVSVSVSTINPLPPLLDVPRFRKTLDDWLSQKTKKYKPAGFKAMLNRASKRAETCGIDSVCDAMEKAMANGWAGWDQDSSFSTDNGQRTEKQRPRLPTPEEDAAWSPYGDIEK